MFKSFIIGLLVAISLVLGSCSVGLSGLQSYINTSQGYQFLYPNGWLQVNVKDAAEGVDVVFRDLIEKTENLSVIISDVSANKTLTDLGTPSEVGYRFFKTINNDPNSQKETELINGESHQENGITYYTLEYQVKLPGNQVRHNIASVAMSRGKLFTFNVSTTQQRWDQVNTLFKTVVNSFSVY